MPPYALPDKWRTTAVKPVRVWLAVLWAIVALAFAVLAAAAVLRGDIGLGLLFTLLFAAVGLGVGVAYEHAGDERGMPVLLNAITLTKARVRPPDSWIHFFRELPPGRWLTICFAATGTFCSVALGWLCVVAVTTGAGWILIVLIPLLLGALVVALAGWIAVVQRWRHASFGRRPIGLSVGRHGVIRWFLDDRVDVWPWESIAAVRAQASAVDKDTGDFMPGIVLVPVEGAPDPTDPGEALVEREYDLTGYQSHAWLIYSTVRYWHEHPELRPELSTTHAQRRIAGWRDGIAAFAAAPPPPATPPSASPWAGLPQGPASGGSAPQSPPPPAPPGPPPASPPASQTPPPPASPPDPPPLI